MRVDLVAFKDAHLDSIKQKSVFHSKELIKERLSQLSQVQGSHMGTLIREDGEVLCILGLIQGHRGFAEVWSVTSEEICHSPVAFHKRVISVLEHFEKEFDLHRIQMTVKESHVEGSRWAESLGFEREALMKNFGTEQENHFLYARFRHG